MPEKRIPPLKMAFQMPTKYQHAGIISHFDKPNNSTEQKNLKGDCKQLQMPSWSKRSQLCINLSLAKIKTLKKRLQARTEYDR